VKKKFSFYNDIVRPFLEKTVSFKKNLWPSPACLIEIFNFLQWPQRIRDDREKHQTNRVIYINNVKPSHYKGESPLNYSSNKIITAKVFAFFVVLNEIKLKLRSNLYLISRSTHGSVFFQRTYSSNSVVLLTFTFFVLS
jgi:hypothetical protein